MYNPDSVEPARPRPLRQGDLVGVAASSSPIQPDLLQEGVRELESLGFRVRIDDSIGARHLYLAGDDDRRAGEINRLLEDPEVRAIFCARGGYGWPRILDRVRWDALRRDPRPLVGFSDATVALGAALTEAGVVCFHGPMVAWDLRQGPSAYDRDGLLQVLTTEEPLGRLPAPGLQVLRPGEGEGPLLGGCLSLLVCMIGTRWMPDLEGAILFVEDWMSKPYQIDRMLQHLRHAGHLSRLSGMVFGQMLECHQRNDDEYTLQEVVLECLEPALPATAPILFGLPSGHVDLPNLTLPLGVRARVRALESDPSLEVLESAVRS